MRFNAFSNGVQLLDAGAEGSRNHLQKTTGTGRAFVIHQKVAEVALRIQLDDALVSRAPQTMILDFGGVGFMDSSGVGLILGRQRIARTLGTALRVQHTPSQLEKVLQLARIPCTDAGQKEE